MRALAIDGRGAPRRGAQLVRHDDEEAALILPVSGECVVLRAVEDGDVAGLEALRARVAALEQAAQGSRLSVVVLGGGAGARRLLQEAGSLWGSGPLTLFQVAPDGRLWCNRRLGAGARTVRPVLKHALQRVFASGAPPVLTLDEQQALRREARPDTPEAREQSAFWTALARRTPWATWTIAAFAALVFVLEMVWGGSTSSLTLYRMGADVRDRVLAGELYRLFSAAFLHIGVAHVVVNLWALVVVGPFLEKILGPARFLVLYALSAVGGSAASVAVGRSGLSAGASGALWGLLAASFALSVWPRGLLPDAVRRFVQTRTWQPLVANFFLSFLPFIDRYAHFGGGLAGGLLVATGAVTRGVRRPGSPEGARGDGAFKVLAAALAALMVGSVATALAVGRPWELRTPPPTAPVALEGTPFVVDVPAGMDVRSAPDKDEPDVLVWEIGNPHRDPASGEIRAARAPSAGVPDAGPVVAPTRSAEGVEGRRSLTTRQGWSLVMEIAWYPEASAGWKAAGDAVVRSPRAAVPSR